MVGFLYLLFGTGLALVPYGAMLSSCPFKMYLNLLALFRIDCYVACFELSMPNPILSQLVVFKEMHFDRHCGT